MAKTAPRLARVGVLVDVRGMIPTNKILRYISMISKNHCENMCQISEVNTITMYNKM